MDPGRDASLRGPTRASPEMRRSERGFSGFLPNRLVVDPSAGYFWLSCERAAASEQADLPLPVESRQLIRVYSCLHR